MADIIDNNETRELIEFYHLGLDTIIQEDFSISCLDGNSFSMEEGGFQPLTEYVVVIELSGISKYQKTIDSFFGIISCVSQNDDRMYFGCGDKISTPTSTTNVDSNNSLEKEEDKNTPFDANYHAVLPAYLDNLIYGEFFGARYCPDHQRYEYNLNLSEEELLIYLGTYFPRSYGESYCLFSSVLSAESIKSGLNGKDCINILDIGCGSGGEIIGLLHALENYLENSIPINIYTFDGNQLVQDILMELVSQFQIGTHTKRRIQVYSNVQRIDGESDIERIKSNVLTFSFDFILCNKMCNELISRAQITDAYHLMCNSFAPLLDVTGLLLILDVTTKEENSSKFYSEILNEQVNNFIIGHSKEYSPLLPISCALHPKCIRPCFTQRKFYISHSQKQNDISKVAYRIVARKTLCDCFIKDVGSVKEIVNESVNNPEDSAFCPLIKI